MNLWIVAFAAILSALTAGPAKATPNFPAEIQAHLMLSYTPPCSLCHANGQTGLGTVTTPFGLTMKANGVIPYDLQSLDAALDAITASMASSVNDGVSDVQKLKNGEDPDVALTGGEGGTATAEGAPFPAPDYGCQVGIASDRSVASPALWGLLLAACSWRRAGRRGRERRARFVSKVRRCDP